MSESVLGLPVASAYRKQLAAPLCFFIVGVCFLFVGNPFIGGVLSAGGLAMLLVRMLADLLADSTGLPRFGVDSVPVQAGSVAALSLLTIGLWVDRLVPLTVLSVLLGLGVATDLAYRRVPHVLVVAGFASLLLGSLGVVSFLDDGAGYGFDTRWADWGVPVLLVVVGSLVCLAVIWMALYGGYDAEGWWRFAFISWMVMAVVQAVLIQENVTWISWSEWFVVHLHILVLVFVAGDVFGVIRFWSSVPAGDYWFLSLCISALVLSSSLDEYTGELLIGFYVGLLLTVLGVCFSAWLFQREVTWSTYLYYWIIFISLYR